MICIFCQEYVKDNHKCNDKRKGKRVRVIFPDDLVPHNEVKNDPVISYMRNMRANTIFKEKILRSKEIAVYGYIEEKSTSSIPSTPPKNDLKNIIQNARREIDNGE